MELRQTGHAAVNYKTYIFTWIALLALTGLTIAVTQFHMGGVSLLIALLIASVHAALVLNFFMLLRYEGRFFKLAFLLPIIVFIFFIGFTFLDVLYR